MHTFPSSLLSRLRRHLRVVALLFVCLMAMKTGFAAACATDSPADLPVVIATVSGADAASDSTQTVSNAEASSDECWHAGAGGCHCACAHVAPLRPHSLDLLTVAASSFRFTDTLAAVRVAPRDDHLRPPIA